MVTAQIKAFGLIYVRLGHFCSSARGLFLRDVKVATTTYFADRFCNSAIFLLPPFFSGLKAYLSEYGCGAHLLAYVDISTAKERVNQNAYFMAAMVRVRRRHWSTEWLRWSIDSQVIRWQIVAWHPFTSHKPRFVQQLTLIGRLTTIVLVVSGCWAAIFSAFYGLFTDRKTESSHAPLRPVNEVTTTTVVEDGLKMAS